MAKPKKAARPAKKPEKTAKPAKAEKTAAKAPIQEEPVAAEAAPAAPAEPETPEAGGKKKPARRATAEAMAARQREISVSEFFTKNRHLLGFDNPAKALLTTVKEAVDNALDACEEAGILPDIKVEIREVSEGRFRVAIEDNGPGIVKPQIPKIFAKLLYGSKFHRLKQSLTAEQKVLVERNGRYERIAIGDLVDAFVSGDGEAVVDVSGERLRVPAFDPKTLRYEWRPVSHVIRHERHNEVLEIRTQQGKRVRVTGCHSLFGYDPESRRVREVEARNLKVGDYVVAPRRIPGAARVEQIRLLDFVTEEELSKRWLYIYGVPQELLASLRDRARVVHAKRGKRSRRYFEIDGVEILEDSFAQYEAKGLLPAWLVKRLHLEEACAGGVLRSYHRGKVLETPLVWTLTPALMRLLGFFVAEGHVDRRQIAFTFGLHERESYASEVRSTAASLGLSASFEERASSLRVKVFGGLVDLLFERLCGRGAKNKRVPAVVFGADERLRQHFLDALLQGDGHLVPKRDALTLTTSSEELAAGCEALWLMQGVVASRRGPIARRGLGRKFGATWYVHVYGADIASSRVFARRASRQGANRYAMFPAKLLPMAAGAEAERIATDAESVVRAVGLGLGPAGPSESLGIVSGSEAGRRYDLADLSRLSGGRVTRHLADHLVRLGYLDRSGEAYAATPKVDALREIVAHVGSFADSDLCFLRVESIERVDDENPYVYDLSVPGCENFVAGDGPLACHNSRGQQGIGISAAGLYGQLTTGRPITIVSKTGKGRPAFKIDLRIDTKRNQPDVVSDETIEWEKDHGTRVEIELVAAYRGGRTGVDAYLEQSVVANPHLELTYVPPKGEPMHFPRVSDELPREAQEIKPHPHGVELGMLLRMLQDSEKKTVKQVLCDDFSRVSPAVAEEVCRLAKVDPKTKAATIHSDQADALHKALGQVKVMAPPASCVVPVGEELLMAGLKRRFPNAEFFVGATRPPAVYRGNPFVVEVAIAFGGDLPMDEPADVMRFANRVPLQYQPKACAISEAVYETNWKAYELQQPKGSLPIGPLAIVVHLASVWVPFTSEAKEAVAHYDELLREMKLALQECGRRLATHLRARARAEGQMKRLSLFQRYIPEVAAAMSSILGKPKEKIEGAFTKALPKFVHVAEEAITPSEPPPKGSMPPPPADDGGPPPSAAPAVATKGKGKKEAAPNGKKKGSGKPDAVALESAKTATIKPPAWPPPAKGEGGKGKSKGKKGKGEQLSLI